METFDDLLGYEPKKKRPMSAKDKIIRFMWEKRLWLMGLTENSEVAKGYFTEHDAVAIRDWPDDQAETVWNGILTEMQDWAINIIGIPFCPFCTIYFKKDCKDCPYANNREVPCVEDSSDYVKLSRLLSRNCIDRENTGRKFADSIQSWAVEGETDEDD